MATLTAKVGFQSIDLYVIPVFVAEMICLAVAGEIRELNGEEAGRALKAYCRWLEQAILSGEKKRSITQSHIDGILAFTECKNLCVWVSEGGEK